MQKVVGIEASLQDAKALLRMTLFCIENIEREELPDFRSDLCAMVYMLNDQLVAIEKSVLNSMME